MDRLREIFTYVCAAMGIFALIFVIYSVAQEKFQAAFMFGVAFIACGIFVFLPQVKAFKLWQIEVQLREKLNEADEILKKLRDVSEVNAKAAYHNLSKGGRWGAGADASEKQALLDEIDSQLKSLGIPDEDRRKLSSTYMRTVGFDFYMLYLHTLERYFQSKSGDMTRRLSANPDNKELAAEVARWREGMKNWMRSYDLYSRLDTYIFADEINRITPSGWLSEPEHKALEAFRNQVLSLYKASQERGGLTKEAAAYYDRYHDLGGQDKKIIELFNFNPSELR